MSIQNPRILGYEIPEIESRIREYQNEIISG